MAHKRINPPKSDVLPKQLKKRFNPLKADVLPKVPLKKILKRPKGLMPKVPKRPAHPAFKKPHTARSSSYRKAGAR